MVDEHHQSLCDRCLRPGSCCTFTLNIKDGDTPLEALALMATANPSDNFDHSKPDPNFGIGLPFIPLARRPSGTWIYWCPHLIKGRCSIYETRPALCRQYSALQDRLCWHFDPTTAHLREEELCKQESETSQSIT